MASVISPEKDFFAVWVLKTGGDADMINKKLSYLSNFCIRKWDD